MRPGRCVFPILFAGLLLARAASAADPKTLDPAAEARRTALFEEGRNLHLQGKHAEAVVKLREVVELRRSPQALRALGLAEEAAERLIEAREHFDEALRMAQESGPPAEVEPAKAALSHVAPLVPRLRFALPPDAQEVSVSVDGARIKLVDGAAEVNPGPRAITVEAKGMRPFTTTAQAKAGAVVEVTVQLQKDAPRSIRRPLGIALVAVGGAGIVAGAVTGGLALVTHDELARGCPGGACPPDQLGKLDGYRTLGAVSTAALIAGGVLAAGGAALWITAPSGDGKVAFTPYIGPGSAGVRVSF